MSTDFPRHGCAIPECRLHDAGFGAQLRRYRELSRHVQHIERAVGRVTVRFDPNVRPGLLEHTLEVEHDCCKFVGVVYDPAERQLTFTVQNCAQDPRLDSLFQALA